VRKFKVRVDGEEYQVEVSEITEPAGSGYRVERIESAVSQPAKPSPLQVTTTVRSPMPGRVLAVNVKQGDQVTAGQVVVILEAMKMENEITVEGGGVVTQVYVEENDTVDNGDPLLEIEEVR